MAVLPRFFVLRTVTRTLALTAMLAACYTSGAAAQGASPPRTVGGAQFRNVTRACTIDYPRFCPAAATGTASGRDQVTCLKFFKNDLSLQCRRAVTAATGK